MKFNKKTIIIGILAIIIISILVFFLFFGNKVSNTKRVDGLVITDTNITYNEDTAVSFLSANVKNNSKEEKSDVKLKITFFDKSKKEITSVTGYLGDIEINQTLELNAAVSMELKNLHNVKYEIIK